MLGRTDETLIYLSECVGRESVENSNRAAVFVSTLVSDSCHGVTSARQQLALSTSTIF